ncbi:MAG: iron-containing alcohol dehydrogenase, partial [Erysipelotrichaceae bacterium]|nr:iron-containing alcohol dehydrogenase [Erysipelotrichaceae bacterium]
PTKFYFGKGEEKNTGKYLKEYGAKKVLLVQYGTGRDYEVNLYNTVKKSLDEAGVESVLFEGVKPNPAYETCEKGKELAR